MSIPTEIFNKIMLYNSHPVADLFKDNWDEHIDEMMDDNVSFYNIWCYERERMKENIRQWKIYKSKYAFYDDD